MGFGGQAEKCALAVAFDWVAYATGCFSLLRPRRPASEDGFERSGVTQCVGLGFGSASGSRLTHEWWSEAG